MGALQHVDKPGYAALLLRRTYAELSKADSLIPRSHEWLSGTPAKWNEDRKTWTFPSGATIEFGHVENETDKYKYQSAAYQYVGFDELTSFSESIYEYIGFSRTRRKIESSVPIRTRSASNPGNIGHAWVQSRFLDDPKPGVFFIPAKAKDNPGLDVEEYEESLSTLPPALRRQLLDGDWGAIEGAAFHLTPDHLIEPFVLPTWWEKFESMDYGLTNPTAWHFWAIDAEGNLIAYFSYYKPGLPSETAPMIKRIRAQVGSKVCYGDPQSLAQPTSTLSKLGTPATIQTEFAERGVLIAKANNDRRTGYTRLSEFLKIDPYHRFPDWHPKRGERGSPRMFIVERYCPDLVKQFRVALLQPLDERFGGEAVEDKWERQHGHAIAAARYGVLTRFPTSQEPERLPEDPRARWMVEHERREESLRLNQPYDIV